MILNKEDKKRVKRERREKRRLERGDWRQGFRGLFESLALFIATHPWKVCILSFLFNGLLGLGMLNLPWMKLLNNDIEDLYVPKGSPTQKQTDLLLKLFPDRSGDDFYPHQNVKQPLFAEIMLWKHDKQNIINETLYPEMEHILEYIKNISTFRVNDGYAKYPDVCARRNGECVIQGEEIIRQIEDNVKGTIQLESLYNQDSNHYETSLDCLADYEASNTSLNGAKYIKIRFHLRQDNETMLKDSKLWRDHFITYMKKFIRKQYPENLHITFSHSGAFYEELGNDTFMDIPYFSFVFTVFLTYLGIVMSGGNIISKRVHIGRIGIIVTPVSVLGAWGLLMGCGLEFTNTIGVIPLFIQCHQIINALITLSHVSDVNDVKDAHKRIPYAVGASAIPITVTTLTHVLPFVVGIASNYYVTKLVSIYFVTTMLFNYFNHFVFFTACLSLHEHRIDAELHFCCWTKLTPREQLREEGRNCCVICCCSGTRPETREDTESGPERLSRRLMTRFILTKPVKVISVLVFIIYFIFTCWGLSKYDFDSVQVNKVLPRSYYSNWDKYWAREFDNTTIIQFISIHPQGYTNNKTMVTDFQQSVRSKPFLNHESLQSWFESYSVSDVKDFTSEDAFITSIKDAFLPSKPVFKHDLVVDSVRPRLIASRFYMKTKDVPTTKTMLAIKDNLEDMVDDVNDYIEDQRDGDDDDDDTSVDPFMWKVDGDKYFLVHCPDFLATDWHMLPLWEILIFTAVQFCVFYILSLIVNPSIGVAIQIPFWYVSMVAGIFGVSYFCGIYLTPVPMILYMVAACYCAEVIAHTYMGFAAASGVSRSGRTNVILGTTSQCLFHTIFGQFLGLLVLIVDESYVFVTVCQLTLITTASCVLHVAFFLPVALSFIGPGGDNLPEDSVDTYKLELTTVPGGSNSQARNGTNGIPNQAFQAL